MKKVALSIVAVLTVVRLGFSQMPPSTQTARPQVPGRYQIFFSPVSRADVYLVDTATGRMWRPINITNAEQPGLSGNPQVWLFQDRLDNNEQLAEWFALHMKAPAPSTAPPPTSAPPAPPPSPQ